jgi:hypothetical protein
MSVKTTSNQTRPANAPSAAPLTGQRAHEIQAFGSVVAMPIALAEKTRRQSADNLNQLLADVITLRDLYKKSRPRPTAGSTSRFSRITSSAPTPTC